MTHHTHKNIEFLPSSEPAGERLLTGKRPAWSAVMFAAVLPVMVLGGCAKHSKDHFTVGSTPQTYKERHPIVLSEQEQTLDVPIASQSYDLSAPAASAVQGFAARYKRSASGTITIMLPSGSPNSGAAEIIGQKISGVLQTKGVSTSRISTITYDASQHGSAAPIRLSYGAVTANVGKCGVWDKDMTETTQNTNYSNFGCATQSNLAAMISNPADLIGPRGSSEIDAARRGAVIEDYRKGTASNENFAEIDPTWDG